MHDLSSLPPFAELNVALGESGDLLFDEQVLAQACQAIDCHLPQSRKDQEDLIITWYQLEKTLEGRVDREIENLIEKGS